MDWLHYRSLDGDIACQKFLLVEKCSLLLIAGNRSLRLWKGLEISALVLAWGARHRRISL